MASRQRMQNLGVVRLQHHPSMVHNHRYSRPARRLFYIDDHRESLIGD
ncbi:MAG: hypothetical protein II265_00835 [Clostridia bacterium]|nr:hypothetical protein [Clostridia bacterium]